MAAAIPRRRLLPRLAWAAVGLYVVLVLIGLRLLADVEPLSAIDTWTFFALLWCAVIGALIVSRDERHPIGWLFIGMSMSFALGLVMQGYALYSVVGQPEPLPATQAVLWTSFWISMPGYAAIVLFLPLLFPDGHLPSPRWRYFAWFSVLLLVTAVAAQMFAPDFYTEFPQLKNPLGVQDWQAALDFYDGASTITLVGLVLLTFVALRSRWQRATMEVRLQIRWFSFAVGCFAVALVLDTLSAVLPALTGFTPFLGALAVTALPTAVGIAILRYRLYDIDIIINRTVVYLALTGVLAGLYTAAVAIFERLIVAATGQTSDVAVVMTLFVLATVFTPIKTKLQTTADKYVKPVGVPAAHEDGGDSAIDDLVRLAELHSRGILTDEEFAAKKKQVLGI